jgi:8-oxo-dGTP pyrophosphatase MutT (NUDIX family)
MPDGNSQDEHPVSKLLAALIERDQKANWKADRLNLGGAANLPAPATPPTNEHGDELLFESEWCNVYRSDGWYYYASGPNSQGVCYLLPYVQRVPDYLIGTGLFEISILARYEITPAHHDGMQMTSITGGIPLDMTPREAAACEMLEEAGYTVTPEELVDLGTARLSKMTDTWAFLFAVNVTDRVAVDPPTDGSRGEQGAFVRWYPLGAKELIWCKDPVMTTMLLRAGWKNLFNKPEVQ